LDPQTHDYGHSYIAWSNSDWLKKQQVTSQLILPVIPPVNSGAHTPTASNPQDGAISMGRYKLAQAAAKKMIIMHTSKDYHFLELQDDSRNVAGYTAIELLYHLLDQYVQLEDVVDQIPKLNKILEQNYV
jgi:hypothetical protein